MRITFASRCEVFVRRIRERFRQTIANFCEGRQLCCQFALELAFVEAPAPVSAVEAGSIHARIAAEAEYVLHRNHAETSGGTLSRADECPVDAVVGAT